MPTFQTARDPVLSLFQSAASAVAHALGGGPSPAEAAAHVVAAETSAAPPPQGTTCAALGLELLRAVIAGDQARSQALQDRLRFSACDPLWAETLFNYAARFLPDGHPLPIPYVRHAEMADFVVTAAASRLRIALVSDWGTGTDEARQVAALIAAQAPDVVIHLGDIYYSGTPEECDRHFLAPLRAVLPDTRLFTLCGNHDVYSGGQGYYGLLRQIGQPASYFCLRSPDLAWQILAADTGLNDHDPFEETAALTFLDPGEEAWHADKLAGFPGMTILLSHHQPFSAYRQIGAAGLHSPVNQKLMDSHARLSQAGPIAAWFWGHEHRLTGYAPYQGVAAGRNIGHGAIPVAAPVGPLPGLQDPPRLLPGLTLDTVDGAYTHGFVVLDATPDGIAAAYWSISRPDGPHYAEVFARPGRVIV